MPLRTISTQRFEDSSLRFKRMRFKNTWVSLQSFILFCSTRLKAEPKNPLLFVVLGGLDYQVRKLTSYAFIGAWIKPLWLLHTQKVGGCRGHWTQNSVVLLEDQVSYQARKNPTCWHWARRCQKHQINLHGQQTLTGVPRKGLQPRGDEAIH